MIGGCRAGALAAEYGTPLYVFDEDALRTSCRAYRQAFAACRPRSVVAYAVKAFGVVEMLRLAHSEGLGLDVASIGELALAKAAGVPPESVTFHGVAKQPAELEAAVRYGAGHVAIDALEEIHELAEISRRVGRRQPVLVRINPDTAVPTDPRYRTSGADCKFGLSVADGSAGRAVEQARAAAHLRLDGLHFHLGSQIMTAQPYVEAMVCMAGFLSQLDGWRPDRIVVGGGMGVQYGIGPTTPTPQYWAEAIIGAFSELIGPLCRPDVTLGIEPGRSVVAEHGSMLYRVGTVKPRGDRPGEVLAVVDGGLSDNPRPLMYSATHQVCLASQPDASPAVVAHIYGRHCETDLLFANVALPAVTRGDILLVRTTGAYTHCMASNYNRFLRPAVVFAAGGRSRLVVRRETPDDLLRTEVC
jgi:diaminopimelate decarboxylase